MWLLTTSNPLPSGCPARLSGPELCAGLRAFARMRMRTHAHTQFSRVIAPTSRLALIRGTQAGSTTASSVVLFALLFQGFCTNRCQKIATSL